jgi:ketosteroid isomerase-like protein
VRTTEDFKQAINDFRYATQQCCNGNANPTKALWSHAADTTIMGGFRSYEHTWEQVGPRIEWAATRFLEGQASFEILAAGQDQNLGYTIWIERYHARLLGSDTIHPFSLRVTHIYRREGGAWKIIHRHADAIMERFEATAILPR